jgi:hypothetical protein
MEDSVRDRLVDLYHDENQRLFEWLGDDVPEWALRRDRCSMSR